MNAGAGSIDLGLAGPLASPRSAMDYAAAGQPTDVLDDEIGQGHGRRAAPKGVELFLNPG